MRRTIRLSVLAFALMLLLLPVATVAQEATPPAAITVDRAAFQDQMRKLWEDHITWTRLYIVSFAADLPDQDATAQRLLQNQTDIGNAIKPFYGEEAGDALTAVLRHTSWAPSIYSPPPSPVIRRAIDKASAAWYANANDIAAFLNTANPDAWPLADLQAQMKMHLDLTLEEATARLKGDYAADIAAYDKIHDHILSWLICSARHQAAIS